MRDAAGDYEARNSVVVGVNPAPVEDHEEYSDEYGWNFPLLSDRKREVARAYGRLSSDGRHVKRGVVVIDQQGVVRYAKTGMPQTADILDVLSQLDGSTR